MGIYNPDAPSPPLLSTKKRYLRILDLQEKSGNGTCSKNAANLEAGCGASELAGRRRVRSSAGGLSTSTHNGAGGGAGTNGRGRQGSAALDRVTSASGDGWHGDDSGGVRGRAGDTVGCWGRGGVVCGDTVQMVRYVDVGREN
jgi:hypothetical protein